MVTEEELAQMTPEELAEFQKQNCVFCQIASGKIPSKEVYSDEESIAVLDINPAAKGHMLLMPKGHYSVMPQLPEHLAEHMFMVTKGLSQAALKALQCKGTTIFVANGVAAGQKAPHFMIHIIPRNDGDGISMTIPSREFSKKDVEAVGAVLKKVLWRKKAVEAEVVKDEKTTAAAGIKKGTSKKAAKISGKNRKQESKKTGKKSFDLDAISDMLGK